MVSTITESESISLQRVGGIPHEQNHRAHHVDVYFPLIRMAFGDPSSWRDVVMLVLFAGRGREADFFAPFVRKLILVDDTQACTTVLSRRFDGLFCAEILQNNGKDLRDLLDESVDYCTALVAFMHILSKDIRDSYAREIQRVLRPGGRALVQVIEGDGWNTLLDGVYGTRNVGFRDDQEVYEYWSQFLAIDFIVRTPSIPLGIGACWWWVVGRKG